MPQVTINGEALRLLRTVAIGAQFSEQEAPQIGPDQFSIELDEEVFAELERSRSINGAISFSDVIIRLCRRFS